MYFSSYLFFFGLSALLLITVSGCSSLQEKTYINHPKTLRKQADLVCQNTDASHFRVENQLVLLKRHDGKELELKHYNSLLPDGYYFCTRQKRKSSILDWYMTMSENSLHKILIQTELSLSDILLSSCLNKLYTFTLQLHSLKNCEGRT